MRDAPGRYARWSAAALVAPVSAAVLSGSISWAAGHHPQAAAKPTTPVAPNQATGISEAELNAQLEQVEALRAQISTLREQVATLTATRAGRTPASTAGTRATGKVRSTPSRPRTSSASAATRAPASHATTGASG